MEEARTGGVGRRLDAVPQQSGDRGQASVTLLGERPTKSKRGVIAARTATGGSLVDAGEVLSGGLRDLLQQARQSLALLKWIGHCRPA